MGRGADRDSGHTTGAAALTLHVAAGRLFQVHVEDPERKLSQAGKSPSETSPAAPDPELVVLLRGPDRLLHHVPMTGRTGAGRDHSMAIPDGAVVTLMVRSKQFGVVDSLGKAIGGELGVTAAPVSITIQGGRP